MAEQRDIKVFISWSGGLARDVAVALREWLPLLFDRIEPFTSDTDIAAGQRGLAQIEAELRDTNFGIVVVTAANQHAPWLNFEAGALSKVIPGDIEQRVVPLLVDLHGPAQLTGPLAQFQAKKLDQEGMLALLKSLAGVAGIDERVTEQRFEAYWPGLEERVTQAMLRDEVAKPVTPKREPNDVLDEVLEIVRGIQRNTAPVEIPPDWVPRSRQNVSPLGPRDREQLTEHIRDLAKTMGLKPPAVSFDTIPSDVSAVANVYFDPSTTQDQAKKAVSRIQSQVPFELIFTTVSPKTVMEAEE